jgi:hypothetical protein
MIAVWERNCLKIKQFRSQTMITTDIRQAVAG